jgi:hypothetical protein
MPGIVLAYIGVHQIFQLGLAAHEMGKLQRLYCSMVDAPGRWGRIARHFSASVLLNPMGGGSMPVDKLRELPLPMLARQLRQRLPFMEQTDYFRSCVWFDKAAARRLEREEASAFIGVETCALSSLRAARQRGMKAILDCPGIPAPFLARQIQLAADDLGIKPPDQSTSARMDDRRQAEMAEADLVLVCSSTSPKGWRPPNCE